MIPTYYNRHQIIKKKMYTPIYQIPIGYNTILSKYGMY